MFPWGQFPFSDDIKKVSENMNPQEIQSYVHQLLKNMMPSSASPSSNSHEQAQNTSMNETQQSHDAVVFETFDHVYIRIQFESSIDMSDVKIYHTSNKAIIENVKDKQNRQVINLPCLVKKRGAVAQVKNQLLEIRLLKSDDLQFTEISVSEK